VKKIGILSLRHGSGERLVEMMVGINQPWQDDMITHVHNQVGCLGQFICAANLVDKPILSVKSPARNFPALLIHGYQKCGVFNE